MENTEQAVSCNLLFLFRKDESFYWLDVTDIENEGQPLPDFMQPPTSELVSSYEAEIEIGAAPGQIFAFKKKGTSIVFLSNKTKTKTKRGKNNPYMGLWDHEESVAKLRAIHSSHEATRKAKKNRTEEATKKYHLELLEPLREVYHKLPSPVRAQLLAQIVQYIVQ